MNLITISLIWFIFGIITFHILVITRNIIKKERAMSFLKELKTCILYGPLLTFFVLFQAINLIYEYKHNKKIEQNIKIKILNLKIASRFDILDL